MTAQVRAYRKVVQTVEATEYDGRSATARDILNWIAEAGGIAFGAAELGWRHDTGSYWHRQHGFIYLPQGARSPGSPIERLRDDEIIVYTGSVYAVVFPGDYVVRSRSGFYPLRAESFHRSYASTAGRRGTATPDRSPPPP